MISWWPWTKCAYRLFFPRGRQLTGFGFSERGVCARCPTSCPPIAPPDSEREARMYRDPWTVSSQSKQCILSHNCCSTRCESERNCQTVVIGMLLTLLILVEL